MITNDEAKKASKNERPPPIFLYGIENYQDIGKTIEIEDKVDILTFRTVRKKQMMINFKVTDVCRKVWDKT